MLFTILIFGVACGCSVATKEKIPVKAEAYPGDLAVLQGTWEQGGSNDWPWCQAVVKGYNLRLAFRSGQEISVFKKNVSIDRLDEKRNMIVMPGNAGAWSYRLSRAEDADVLDLEFYYDVAGSWKKIQLQRVMEDR